MKLSIIVPVYNEETTVSEILNRLFRLPVDKEIIVVDDGSTDGTPRILDQWPGGEFHLLRHPANRGKGSAIRTGLTKVTGDIVVIQDADLEYDPADLLRLMRPILDETDEVVYGSRILGNPSFYSMGVCQFHKEGYYRNPFLTVSFYFGGRFVTWLTNLLFHSSLTDQPTCYKMFRKEVLERIHLSGSGFEFCSEITAKVLMAGHSIAEIPVSYHPRRVSEGKKLNWKDGLQAIMTLLHIRFFPES
jgi:dolichol-phosphate mannosyltransferase